MIPASSPVIVHWRLEVRNAECWVTIRWMWCWWPPISMRQEISIKTSPGLKTVDGVADIGFARMAWFIDPGKNCVGIMQLK